MNDHSDGIPQSAPKLLLAFALAAGAAGCNGDLSRDYAADAIRQHENLQPYRSRLYVHGNGRRIGVALGLWSHHGEPTSKGQQLLTSERVVRYGVFNTPAHTLSSLTPSAR